MLPSSRPLTTVTFMSFGVAALGFLPLLYVLGMGALGIEVLPKGNNGLGLFVLAPMASMYAGAMVFVVGLAGILIRYFARKLVQPTDRPREPSSPEQARRTGVGDAKCGSDHPSATHPRS